LQLAGGFYDCSMREKPKRLSWDDLVEERIRQAQDDGQFDQLAGLGEKCAAIDEPYDELWWVRRLLKREGLGSLPISLEIRRVVEVELARIATLADENAVRAAVAKLNERIRDANYRAVHGPMSTTCQLDIDEIVARWRAATLA
jgi:hypothetical protein